MTICTRHRLTGRVRGRPALFGKKVVIQVEWKVDQAHYMHLCRPQMPPGHGGVGGESDEAYAERIEKCWWPVRTEWKDATLNDMQAVTDMANERAVLDAVRAALSTPSAA